MKNKKRIAFDDTDGRHAKLRIQLQRDGLSQAEFFRAYITAYLEKDSNVMSFIQDYKLNNSVGQKRSIILEEIVLIFSATLNFSWGKRGVRCSKETLSLTNFGSNPLILSTFISGKYLSPSFGGLTEPKTVSPVFKPNSRI